MYTYIYIYIYTHTHIHIYIYIHREREREIYTYMDMYICMYDMYDMPRPAARRVCKRHAAMQPNLPTNCTTDSRLHQGEVGRLHEGEVG